MVRARFVSAHASQLVRRKRPDCIDLYGSVSVSADAGGAQLKL